MLAVRIEVRGSGSRLQFFWRMRLRYGICVCVLARRAVAVSSVLLSFLICRGRAGPETPAFCMAAGHGAPGEASCVLVSMLGFCTKCQCFSLICCEGPVFRASLCWLAALGEGEGLSEQRALGCFRFNANLVALRVLPMLQNGVSVLGSRWGGQPVLRSLCALQVAVVFV